MKFAIFLAPGFEESEAIITYDILKRGDQEVELVNIENKSTVISAHQVEIKTTMKLSDLKFENFDGFVLPGGIDGVKNLSKNKLVRELISRANQEQKIIGAICAAPLLLSEMGILDEREIVAHPSVVEQLDKKITIDHNSAAITDGHIVTGASVGSSFNFALALADFALETDQILTLRESLEIRD
ncbi:DJ-1 family glyoxalase III [Spiroplasma endosymbiont of Amphibalanus improvisus]|uniref:DJ-1 family glyoxalase III n=1 Tax=Spiroplasma endosymbiont of Amphibalanus improvisus TaxID=3066327 RepID=UPI00313E8452